MLIISAREASAPEHWLETGAMEQAALVARDPDEIARFNAASGDLSRSIWEQLKPGTPFIR